MLLADVAIRTGVMIVSIHPPVLEIYNETHSQVFSIQCGLGYNQPCLLRWDGPHKPADTSCPALSVGRRADADAAKQRGEIVDADGDVIMLDNPF